MREKIELVKFKDGEYGVRKTVKRLFKKPEYYYLDMSPYNPEYTINTGGKHWWMEQNRFIYGKTKDYELAKEYRKQFDDFGESEE